MGTTRDAVLFKLSRKLSPEEGRFDDYGQAPLTMEKTQTSALYTC